jgi:hypothetical protein
MEGNKIIVLHVTRYSIYGSKNDFNHDLMLRSLPNNHINRQGNYNVSHPWLYSSCVFGFDTAAYFDASFNTI